MKVYKTRRVPVEIGPLDAYVLLDGSARHRHGLRMTCDACWQKIEGNDFAGGFKSGHPNLILHVECVPEGTPNPRATA